MKLCILSNLNNPKTGKGLFLSRLASELVKLDVDIVDAANGPDIVLHPVKMKRKINAINVLRLDGVCHDLKKGIESSNKPLKASLRQCDAVVYQGRFSRKMCNLYLGKAKVPIAIINNGASPEYWLDVPRAGSSFKYNFLAASRWRPHKRLGDIIESFILADIPDSALYIAGDLSKSNVKSKRYRSFKNIIFLGSLDQRELAAYQNLCDALVHICWIDCCPNSVVEAICAKKIVITNNVGGTRAIVEPSNGIICDIDKAYDFKPCNLYNPPPIDREIIAQAMRDATVSRGISCEHVDIKNIAKKYHNFFAGLL